MFESALTKLAERLAERLIARGETIALVETASGGLASAALLAVPGASAYFVGSAVAYSRKSRHALLSLSGSDVAGLEPMSDGMGIAFARRARTRCYASGCATAPSPTRASTRRAPTAGCAPSIWACMCSRGCY